MRAYLIDPEHKSVSEVDYNGDYRNIYEHIKADCFDAAGFNNKGDAVFVDDEGLLHDPEFFFRIEGNPNPLAGRGLVLGTDAEGESISPTVTLDWLRSNVSFGQVVTIDDKNFLLWFV